MWEKSGVAAGVGVWPIVSWYRCGANPLCGTQDAALYALEIDGGHPIWYVRDDGVTSYTARDLVSNVTDNQWHLLVGTIIPAPSPSRSLCRGPSPHASRCSTSPGV